MSGRTNILPPSSLGESLAPLLGLTDDQFKSLVKLLKGPRGYQPRKADVDALKQSIPSAQADLSFLIPALRYLNIRVAELTDDNGQREDAIREVASAVAVELRDAQIEFKDQVLTSRLSILLEEDEQDRYYQKLRRLSSGFLPSATAFATLVDLRPDFSDDDVPEIRSYLPVIQFRIRTDSPISELKSFVFQIDRESLFELKKVVARAEKKLQSLQEYDALKGRVLDT